MTPKAIFWDNDGVLVDTEHLYFEANRQVLAGIDVPLTEEDYIDLFMVQARGAWHLAEARGVSLDEIERLREERNAIYARLLTETPCLIDGITEVLRALHGRFPMGVVTSSRRDHFDLIHERTDLRQYFDFVVTSDDCTRVKPHPEPYHRALELSGCQPAECLAIEDSERGLAAATAAGISCLVVPTRLTSRGRFTGAHRVMAAADEVLDLLSIRPPLPW